MHRGWTQKWRWIALKGADAGFPVGGRRLDRGQSRRDRLIRAVRSIPSLWVRAEQGLSLPLHRRALSGYGLTSIHRRSWSYVGGPALERRMGTTDRKPHLTRNSADHDGHTSGRVGPMSIVLEVRDLRTEFHMRTANVVAVDGVSLRVDPGECGGMVGESGCGKSTTGFSIMRLLPANGHVSDGRILLNGRNLADLSEKEMQAVRGNKVALIAQDPLTSLNPTTSIGRRLRGGPLAPRRQPQGGPTGPRP